MSRLTLSIFNYTAFSLGTYLLWPGRKSTSLLYRRCYGGLTIIRREFLPLLIERPIAPKNFPQFYHSRSTPRVKLTQAI
jgi:hypothetical protein